ncbi:hypothetical protein DITRI_Ditri13aG0008700 [Diplodiscus trichospermus]
MRSTDRETASLSMQTIYHYTHSHPLTKVPVNAEFLCNGCRTLGSGIRYRCEHCNFDLHDHCATCPLEFSSFMHHHGLKLVHEPQANRVCDLCNDPVEGLFYRCNLCNFNVHPLCTNLPEYVRHVLDRHHDLRLQRLVPGWCMVCNDTCSSWRYRCGTCNVDIHIACVLARPAEVTATASTSRSSGIPARPPSALPFSDARPPPYYDPYYGAIPPPPDTIYSPPPYFCPYPHGYGPILPAPYPYFTNYSGFPLQPPYYPGYGIPPSSGHHVQGNSGMLRKKMYEIARQLAIGVASNVFFGTLFSSGD